MSPADVILVMLPPWEPKRPPLGLAYIAEYVRSCGFKPKVIDFNINLYQSIDKSKRIFWDIDNINSMGIEETTYKMFNLFKDEIDALVAEIVSSDTNIIGFSVNIVNLRLAGKIATLIKKRNKEKIIVMGGTGCFWETNRSLLLAEDVPSVDILVIGEGEEILKDILTHGPDKLNGIKGIIYKKDDFFKPAMPYYAADLNRLPFPTFSDFELDKYTDPALPLLISRGCIGGCSFCIDRLISGTYRFRSVQEIIREIKYHGEKNQRNTFALNDLICNGNLKQLEMFCDSIIESNLAIEWGSYAMIRKDMSFSLLKKMREAGCVFLCYGVESASDFVLKKMNKYYNSSDAERVIRSTHEAGIFTAVNIIVGFPGETKDDFNKTINFVEKNRNYISELTNISSFVLMPDSKVGRNPQEYGFTCPEGKEKECFIDSNNTDLNERIRRLRKTIFVSCNLGIKDIIINQFISKRSYDKNHIVLLSIPPGRIDLPSYAIAETYSFLQSKECNPILYDLNVKLYNAVDDKGKKLWDSSNWYLWNELVALSLTSGVLAEKLFDLMNEIICLPCNAFYFSINKENFLFSVKVATIFRKWLPSIQIIFGGPILKDIQCVDVIPQGTVDMFLSDAQALVEGKFVVQGSMQHNEASDMMVRTAAAITNFKEFNLREYENVCLPLRWNGVQ